MTGRRFAELVDDVLALQDIAEAAGVSMADARRVLAAAGRQPAATVVRLCGGEMPPRNASARADNRRAG